MVAKSILTELHKLLDNANHEMPHDISSALLNYKMFRLVRDYGPEQDVAYSGEPTNNNTNKDE